MSAARLNVWVTRVGDPCVIDMTHQWYVHVLHCNGRILSWCGRKYTNLATKCGHLEIDLPPGCYMVCATWSPAPAGTVTPHSLGNHITHLVPIRADCGDHLCVTLFPPTFHWCGIWWHHALRENLATGRFPDHARDVAMQADRAVGQLLAVLEPDPFTQEMLEIRDNPPQVDPATGAVAADDTAIRSVDEGGGEDEEGKKPKK